jgi:hypothetical protein
MMQRYFLPFILCMCLSLGLAPVFRTTAAKAPVLLRPGQQGSKPGNDEKTLVVYPNPSTGIVQLTINNLQGKKVELSVLNVIGSVMYRETLTELNDRYTKVLDLSKFANGLYYVRLESDNTSQMCKLVIR